MPFLSDHNELSSDSSKRSSDSSSDRQAREPWPSRVGRAFTRPTVFLALVGLAVGSVGLSQATSVPAIPTGSSTHESEVEQWLERAQQAHALEQTMPSRFEIVADYEYFDGSDSDRIWDRSVFELPGTLFQERRVGETHLERALDVSGAYVEGPSGRLELQGEMLEELEEYLCLRRLEFLSLCDRFVARLDPAQNQDLVWIRIENEGELFARLGLDPTNGRLLALHHHSRLMEPDLEGDIERTSEFLVRFEDHRPVDGWLLPHRVSTLRDGELSSRYEVLESRIAP